MAILWLRNPPAGTFEYSMLEFVSFTIGGTPNLPLGTKARSDSYPCAESWPPLPLEYIPAVYPLVLAGKLYF